MSAGAVGLRSSTDHPGHGDTETRRPFSSKTDHVMSHHEWDVLDLISQRWMSGQVKGISEELLLLNKTVVNHVNRFFPLPPVFKIKLWLYQYIIRAFKNT